MLYRPLETEPGKVSTLANLLRRVAWLVGWLALLNMGLASCSSLPGIATAKHPLTEVSVSAVRKEVPAAIAPLLGKPTDLWGRIAWGLTWERNHPAIKPEIEHILSQPNFFNLLSDRALPGLAWIVSEIERLELPMELALIPVIESMLDPWAYSSQRAAGLWQISPATASHYGLEVNWWYDARLDIPVATEFALSYLAELQQAFGGDWPLALAAYNGGRGRVGRALESASKIHEAAGFWQLKLPRETRRYVPRILALAEIISHPARFNLSLPQLSSEFTYSEVATEGQIELSTIAELARIDLAELRQNNPAHLRWATVPDVSSTLWLPSSSVEEFQTNLAKLDPSERVSWAHYKVAPGDTLSAIAQRFNTQIALISAANALENSLIRSGDTLLIPKGAGNVVVADSLAREWPPKRRPNSTFHKVREGDSLWRIAQRYGTSVVHLANLNGLDPSAYLQLGQRLKLR